MTPTKPLIIGAGYLGTLIAQHLPGATLVDYPTVDITNLDSIRAAAQGHDLIINCAAWTNTGQAELPENRSKVFSLNVEGPALLSMAAREQQIPLVHFSTGMMFDGAGPTGEGWQESDLPEPTGYYAQTKYWGDALLLPTLERDRVLVFRIHIPVSRHSLERNFLNRLRKFDRAVDVSSSLTVVEDLLVSLDRLLQTEQWGLYNAVNTGQISAYELATKLFEAGLREQAPLPLTQAELDAMPGAHQTFPILSTKKLAAAGCELPDVRTSVDQAIAHFG